MSSKEGFVPLENAVLSLGIAGVDGIGEFSLKTLGVGCDGCFGGSVYRVLRV